MKKQLWIVCFLLVGVLAASAQNVSISRAYADSTFNVCGTGLFKLTVSGATPINFTLELDSAADRVSFISVIDSSGSFSNYTNNDSTVSFTASTNGTFYYRVKFDCAAMSTSSGTVNITQQVKQMGSSLASTPFNVNTYTLLRPAPASLSIAAGDRAMRELLFAVSGNAPYLLDSSNSVFAFNYRTPSGIVIDSVIVDYYNNQTIVNAFEQSVDDTICSFNSIIDSGSFTVDTIKVKLILTANTCSGDNAYLNYSYGCSLLDNCKVDSLEDAINISSANNRLTITKLNCPTDTSCYAPLDTVQWMYKMANNNSFSLNNVFLQLYLDETIWKHAFSFIDYNSIAIQKNTDPLTVDTNTTAIKFQEGGYQPGAYRPHCLTTSLAQGAAPIYGLRYPKGTFLSNQLTGGDTLQPGESYILKFSTYRCCASDSIDNKDYTQLGIYINHWQLECTGNNLCNVLTRAMSDTLCGGPYNNGTIFSQISEEGKSGPDFKLEQDYTPAASDLYVASQGVCDTTAALRERITASNYQLDTTRLMHDRGLYERVGNGFKVILKVSLQAGLGLKPFDDDVPQSPTSSNEFYLSYNAINYNAIQTNFTDLGSNGSEISALFSLEFGNATLFNNFMSNFTVHYALYPCCPAEAVPGYSITTYINPKPSYCDTCFIPLSRKENSITIHCPGCLLPGIESVNYTLLRLPGSYGWLDDTMVSRQNGKAWINGSGAAEKINPLSYPGVFNLNKSIVGDTLEGKLIAYFNDGTSNAYHHLTAAAYDSTHPNDLLRYFYIEQFIPEGDSLHYNVSPFSNSNYMHRLLITSVNDTGILVFNLTDSAQFQSKDTTNGRLFTYRFDKDAISNAIGRTYTLQDGDNYLLYNYFTVCGNPVQGDLWNNNMDPLVNTSSNYEVRNSMYLSGISTIAPGTALIGNAEKATELYALLCDPQQPDTCNIPADSLRPEWLYNCGNSGGFHFFYSVPSQVRVVAQNMVNGTNSNSCVKRIIIEESSAIGGYNNSSNGLSLGRILNVFNNEVRPIRPSGFQPKINVSLPNAYQTYYSNHQGGFISRGSCNGSNSGFARLRSPNDSTLSYSSSAQHVSIPFDLATDSSYSTLACNGDTTINAPAIMLLGDEHYYHNYNLYMVPNCPLVSGTSSMAISNISINRGTPGCGTIDTSTLIALTGYSPDSLSFSLPINTAALKITAIPTASYDDVSNTYCHTFDISNTIPGFTANYPWLYIPANTNVINVNSVTADSIFQDLDNNNTVLGYWIHLPTINAQAPLSVEVCYSTPCLTDSVAYQLPFYYGWHCTNHPIGIDPMSTCDYQTDTFNFTTPSISLRLPKSIPLQSDSITRCGANNFTACISSEQSQGLRSVIYYLSLPEGMEYVAAQLSDTNWQIASVDTNVGGCIDTNAIAITALPIDSTAQLNLNETLCLTYTVTTTCAYGVNDLPTTCISGSSYCGSLVDSALTQTYQTAGEVVDSCNCSVSLSCYPDNISLPTDIILDNINTSSLGYHILNTNNRVIISGTLTVDNQFSILSCEVYLLPFATIRVLQGDSLIIENGHLQAACDTMWQGIEVEAGAYLRVGIDSEIEDAIAAISNQGGATLIITGTRFNENYNGILLSDGAYTDLTLTSNSFTNDNGALTLTPYIGIKSHSYVTANACTALQIGAPQVQQGNRFDDASFGIIALCSDVTIQNNLFQNFLFKCIVPGEDCEISSTAVYASGPSYDASLQVKLETSVQVNPACDPSGMINEVRVGGSQALEKNVFTNCANAIVLGHQINAEVVSNIIQIDTTQHYTTTHTRGITARYGRGVSHHVKNNKLIYIDKNIDYYGMQSSEITITGNSINSQISSGGSILGNFGVWFRNYQDKNENELIIQNDTIYQMRSGILVTNGVKEQIINNSIKLPDSTTNQMVYGIKLESGMDNNVEANKIRKPTATDSLWRDMVTGIQIESSDNNIVASNLLQQIPTGIRIFNTESQTVVKCNTLLQNSRGVFLSNSKIGNQGATSSPSDNYWTLPSNGQIIAFIENTPAPIQAPLWYVKQINGFDPAGRIRPAFSIDPEYTTGYGCDQLLVLKEEQQQELYAKTTANTLDVMEKYENAAFVFKKITGDDSLLHLNTTLDYYLQSYYDSLKQTEHGQLDAANAAVNNSDSLLANVMSSNINTTNNASFNTKELLRIVSEGGIIGGLQQFDEANVLLQNISWENPISGGAAVYGARAALGLDLDDYIVSSHRVRNNTNDTYSKEIILKPNPTTGMLTLQMRNAMEEQAELNIYSTQGSRVHNQILETGLTQYDMDLAHLPVGKYQLVLHTDHGIVFSSSFVRVK